MWKNVNNGLVVEFVDDMDGWVYFRTNGVVDNLPQDVFYDNYAEL
jgi:hypothetical protein